jgi:hypothetical protein
VWRYHEEVTSQLEKELEKEQTLPPYVRQEDMSAMEWVTAHERVERHASVSIDGVKVLLRDEGYREVKIVSVSEVVGETEEEESDQGTKTARRCKEDSVAEEGPGVGCQKGVKLKRHSYRAILGDKAAFTPALKGELACRRVRQADKISAVNDGAEWIWDLVKTYLPERTIEILDWPHAVENLAKVGGGNSRGTSVARAAEDGVVERATDASGNRLVSVAAAIQRTRQGHPPSEELH